MYNFANDRVANTMDSNHQWVIEYTHISVESTWFESKYLTLSTHNKFTNFQFNTFCLAVFKTHSDKLNSPNTPSLHVTSVKVFHSRIVLLPTYQLSLGNGTRGGRDSVPFDIFKVWKFLMHDFRVRFFTRVEMTVTYKLLNFRGIMTLAFARIVFFLNF